MKKLIVSLFIFIIPLYVFADVDTVFNDNLKKSCNGSSKCVDNFYKYFHVISRSCIFTNTKPCYFQLKEPLTLTGTLTYIIDYSSKYYTPGERYQIFKPHDAEFSFLIGKDYGGAYFRKSFKDVENMLPKWFKDTMLAGSVSFNVEIILENKGIGQKDNSISGYMETGFIQHNPTIKDKVTVEIFPKSVKFISKNHEHKTGLSSYKDGDIENFYTLNTSNDYINLRTTPNGKIISKIYKSNADNIVLIDLDKIRSYISGELYITEWVQVVYFPNKIYENNYMVGYVHRDQIKVIDKFNF